MNSINIEKQTCSYEFYLIMKKFLLNLQLKVQ